MHCQTKHPRPLEYDLAHLRFSQQAEQLTTFHEVHNHVQVLRVRECSPKSDQEWMFDFCQHPPLIVSVLNLLHLDNLLLLQHLDGIETLVMLRLRHVYTTETTSSQCSANLKVGNGVFALGALDVTHDGPCSISHWLDVRCFGICWGVRLCEDCWRSRLGRLLGGLLYCMLLEAVWRRSVADYPLHTVCILQW